MVMREQKASVVLRGKQDGQKYSEYFIVSATCADGATHKVVDFARARRKGVVAVEAVFKDWLHMNDQTPVTF